MKYLRLLSFFLFAMFMATSLASAVAPARPPEPPMPAQEKLPPPPPAEVLAKITAPVANPVIKTKQGYSVAVDRSKQVLSVRTPKKDIWISPNVEARQTVEVITDGAPLQQDSRVLAKLKKGRILYAVEEKGEWLLTPIVQDGEMVRGWVQKKHLKPVAEDYPPQKSLAQHGERFASAAMLIQKGKQFDDGLYAAVELAMQNGIGPVEGKKEWLPRLASKIEAAQGGVPLAQLFAAVQLGGTKAALPTGLAKTVDQELKAFMADEKRSKPLGFYSWSKELENIFRQDRMLQTANDVAKNKTALEAVAKALAADVEARKSYEQAMRLNERLTNKLMSAGYRPLLAQIDAGQSPQASGAAVSFFPSSRSHEADLVMKLYGNKPIPPGFELMTEVIKRLRSGDLSFQPTAESGWYDHQLWSLEPLVRYDALPEAKKAQSNDEYRKHLEELFKGIYALMRETHVKQLAHPAPGEAAPGGPPPKEREKVFIQPEPHAELLPTMYARRAQSYQFVRQVLEETFGKEHVAKMHRLTANGPVEMNLAAELNLMERLFGGAYIVACRDLGLAEALLEGVGAGQPADEQAAIFLRWVASLGSDPDLAPDARMMVLAFYDVGRKKTKVWTFLGWESAHCSIDYVQHPGINITDADGKPVPANEGPEVIYYASYRSLATPVFAEVYVTKLLNRSEFRRHCDAYQTKAAILANLE